MHTKAALRARLAASLQHVARGWRREMDDMLAPFGLTEATAVPLVSISRIGEGVRQNALAEALRIEGPSLVRVLDHLCAAGLVERREDCADRRAKTLHLTETGRETTARIETALAALRARMLDGVSEADLEASLRVFAAIEASVGRTMIPVAKTDAPASAPAKAEAS